MPKRYIAILLPVAFLALTGFSCSKKVAENVAENAIEKSTNGQADVDLDDNTLTINTNGSSLQAGEKVELPATFPSDVHVIDGTIKSVVTTDQSSGYSVTVETSSSVTDVKTEYERELAADGWTIGTTTTIGTSATLAAQKDDRTTTIGIYGGDALTTVLITRRRTTSAVRRQRAGPSRG